MNLTTPDLVTVGGLTVDNVITADGVVALARVGGNAAYSGVGARCFVDRVGLVSLAVSTYPQATLDRLEQNGLILDGVTRHLAALRHVDWFIYDAEGHRAERLRSLPGDLVKAGFSDTQLSPDEVRRWIDILKAMPEPAEPSYSQFRHDTPMTAAQVPPSYLKARGVHLAPCRLDVLMEMSEAFSASGRPMTLDPGWQISGEPLDALRPLLGRVDAFLPSEVELRALAPGAELADGLALLAGACRGTVAVKLGPRGSLVWDRGRKTAVHVPALRTKAVDPTGAGDSWGGGFLAGLVETGDPVLAAGFGTVAASRIISHFGADGALPVDHAANRALLSELVGTTPNQRS